MTEHRIVPFPSGSNIRRGWDRAGGRAGWRRRSARLPVMEGELRQYDWQWLGHSIPIPAPSARASQRGSVRNGDTDPHPDPLSQRRSFDPPRRRNFRSSGSSVVKRRRSHSFMIEPIPLEWCLCPGSASFTELSSKCIGATTTRPISMRSMLSIVPRSISSPWVCCGAGCRPRQWLWVVEWATLHQGELLTRWERARKHEPLERIEPLL